MNQEKVISTNPASEIFFPLLFRNQVADWYIHELEQVNESEYLAYGLAVSYEDGLTLKQGIFSFNDIILESKAELDPGFNGCALSDILSHTLLSPFTESRPTQMDAA